jgi:hypothetical protein
VLLAAAILMLAACSTASLVYDNGDWLVYRWTANLLDPTPTQRDVWRERFAGLLEEHRECFLPAVTDWLEDLETLADEGLDERRLGCLVDRFDTLYRAHAQWLVPVAAEILMDLSPAQQAHLAATLGERNADYADDYLGGTPGERREARVERYLERIERWTGALNAEQRALVSTAIGAMPEAADEWLDYRRAQQQTMLSLLRGGAPRERIEAFLVGWWVDLDGRPAALVERLREVRERSIRLAVDLDRSIQPTQREHFVEEVADLRDDLDDAADQTPGMAGLPSGGARCG